MSRLRRRAGERLKLAQDTAAMLTTFNEVDMTAVTALRAAHGEAFEQKHGVRLGLMSFFVKAAVLRSSSTRRSTRRSTATTSSTSAIRTSASR